MILRRKINAKNELKQSNKPIRLLIIEYIESFIEEDDKKLSNKDFCKFIIKSINEYLFKIENKNTPPNSHKGIFNSVMYHYRPELINKLIYQEFLSNYSI